MVIGCLWLSDGSVIIYDVGNLRWTSQKIWEISCTEFTGQGNDFELIPAVKIETRNPVEGYSCSEFPAICNHCGVMAAWNHKTLKILEKILQFFGKTTRCGKIFYSVANVFVATLIDVLCSNLLKFGRREIGEIVRCLPDKRNKIFTWLSSCRYCADCAQNRPGPAPDNSRVAHWRHDECRRRRRPQAPSRVYVRHSVEFVDEIWQSRQM